MFGIAWGVGSLLVLVGLGEGFRSGQHKQMATMGNDIIMMWNSTIPALANQHTGMRPYQLTSGDAEALRALPELRAVTVELSRSDLYEVSQWSNTSSRVIGVLPNYSTVKFLPMVHAGRFLTTPPTSPTAAGLPFSARKPRPFSSRAVRWSANALPSTEPPSRSSALPERSAVVTTTPPTSASTSPSPPCRSSSRSRATTSPAMRSRRSSSSLPAVETPWPALAAADRVIGQRHRFDLSSEQLSTNSGTPSRKREWLAPSLTQWISSSAA